MRSQPRVFGKEVMMKKRMLIMVIFLLTGLVFGQAVLAAAPPPLPSSFYGTVKFNGENVAVGATVTAWINGVWYADSLTELYQANTVFSLDVPGDQTDTPAIEGGKAGDTVVFKVNGVNAVETATWQSGVNAQRNLTLTSAPGYFIFVPVILK